MDTDFILYKLINGDEDSFTFIFNKYYKGLVLFAMDFVSDRDKAEEIVQGVFVKLWENHEKLEIKSSLKSYLLKSVQNKCLDYHKHHKIKRNFEDTFIKKTQPFQSADDYLAYDFIESVEKCIKKLPERTRQIFKLSRYHNMKHKDIAKQLNISVKTVEAGIGAALQQLRKDMKDWL